MARRPGGVPMFLSFTNENGTVDRRRTRNPLAIDPTTDTELQLVKARSDLNATRIENSKLKIENSKLQPDATKGQKAEAAEAAVNDVRIDNQELIKENAHLKHEFSSERASTRKLQAQAQAQHKVISELNSTVKSKAAAEKESHKAIMRLTQKLASAETRAVHAKEVLVETQNLRKYWETQAVASEKQQAEAEARAEVAEARAIEAEAEATGSRDKQQETETWGQYWEAEAMRDRAAALAAREQAADAMAQKVDAQTQTQKAEARQLEAERVQAETEEWGQSWESTAHSYRRGELKPVPLGRPRGRRGAAALERDWEGLTREARNMALGRHAADIYEVLERGGADDWNETALATALKQFELVEGLWACRPFVDLKLAFAKELADTLAAEWNVALAIYIKSDLSLSDSQYLKLRLALSKVYRNGKWDKRLWYHDELTDQKIYLPEPLVPRWRWFPIYREHVTKYGLELNEDGKVCGRGFLATLEAMIVRDAANFFQPTISRPWHPCFGIDGTSISRLRSFTHTGITLGGLYVDQACVVSSELKLMTLAIGQHHDDAHGIEAIIGGDAPTPIAAEFTALANRKALDLDLEDGHGLRTLPCEPVGCFDLAAARGIRGCKGKAVCLCGCQGKKKLQAYPGDGTVPSLPDVVGDALAEWRAAEAVLANVSKGGCSYGSELMSAASIRAAAHIPPDDHNFAAGPWTCSHCNKIIWRAHTEFAKAKAELKALKAKAVDDDEAKREYNALITTHTEGHMDQMLYQDGALKVSTCSIIVDPMHCLELNLGKVAWKWTFGNRMDAKAHERVAEYLNEINLSLDIREKGKRDRNQKWFTASAFDEFVLGTEWDLKSKSHGLARNIYAIVERVHADAAREATAARIILGQAAAASSAMAPPPPPPPPAPPAAPPPPKKGGGRRNKCAAPVGGFGLAAQMAEMAAAGVGEEEGAAEEDGDDDGWAALAGSEVESSLRQFLSTTYGNKSTEVIDTLAVWEAYGEVFGAWRDEWTADTDLYRAQRALRLLKAAIKFAKALNKTSNFNHMSWYVHLLIFVVTRQMFKYGNTWRFSTAAIESRGARLKRLGRAVTNWRSIARTACAYNYIDQRSGAKVQRTQKYNSSAMQQMLLKVALHEELAHTTDRFARPATLRLRQAARATKIKIDLGDQGTRLVESSMLSAVKKASHASSEAAGDGSGIVVMDMTPGS